MDAGACNRLAGTNPVHHFFTVKLIHVVGSFPLLLATIG